MLLVRIEFNSNNIDDQRIQSNEQIPCIPGKEGKEILNPWNCHSGWFPWEMWTWSLMNTLWLTRNIPESETLRFSLADYGMVTDFIVEEWYEMKSQAMLALVTSLQWRHSGCDSVPNHQPHDCFLNRLFKENIKAPRHWPHINDQ